MAFKFSFDKYMEDVYSQLECNVSNEYEKMYITFTYSKEEVENNIDYFKRCYNKNISAYKALTFMK